VSRDCISAPELLGVLGTGTRISVDILELGSYLVGREELGFGQCFMVQQRSRRHLDNGWLLASGSGISNYAFF
jgi:hypothetical protein